MRIGVVVPGLFMTVAAAALVAPAACIPIPVPIPVPAPAVPVPESECDDAAIITLTNQSSCTFTASLGGSDTFELLPTQEALLAVKYKGDYTASFVGSSCAVTPTSCNVKLECGQQLDLVATPSEVNPRDSTVNCQ